ncbi:IclR family transcriptional regulator [Natrialba asiatica]|uniref:IclR family transcriptional regulator n=1 Tax=Natrialba asiatica (strain ATCC 700177 / DSM 12278 / JCM 9576 / FERM P-10747 / NBRC 102637 / 172P1) TaxID=29540 RepID=M0B5I1_NATA1|nr:IclR family transcriptional regulator [Natrialba asiatica]ELZ06050.1 IclR family transcriptional regulator [Natrialba asiatica DSM 12278]
MADPKYPVRTVGRTFEILEIIQELDGAGVSEIAARVDIGKSAVHNHLTTLENYEYVDKDGDEYHIGLSFLGLGAYARNRTPIYDTAQSQVDELADETGELVNLLVEKNGKGIYLYQSKGENAVELDTHEGKRVRLHCTGLGKAILAFRPDETVDEIIADQGLPELTPQTITDRDAFDAELEEIRDQRYAVDREERLNGLRCIAAPITDDSDRSIAAISVACPVHRVDDDRFYEALPEAVLGAANVIELEYNYS